jgi:hypothetical protein
MSATEIKDLLVEMLAGAAGREPSHWRKVIGEVEVQVT